MEQTAAGQVLYIIRSEDGLWETRFLAVHSDPDYIKKDEVIGQRDGRVARSAIKQQVQQQVQQQVLWPPLQANVRPGDVRLRDYTQVRL